jgi:hypothetical protein
MAKMKELSGIVDTIAEGTRKAIYKDIDWEIAECNAEGDEYNAIHSYLMAQVITKMYKDLQTKYDN